MRYHVGDWIIPFASLVKPLHYSESEYEGVDATGAFQIRDIQKSIFDSSVRLYVDTHTETDCFFYHHDVRYATTSEIKKAKLKNLFTPF